MKHIRLYLSFAKVSIRSQLAHRSAYWAGIIGQWLAYGTTFLTLYIMVSQFDLLAGWNAQEVLIMYAINLLSYAMGACFFFNPSIRLAAKIRTGEFDGALTKPVSPFLHEFYTGFNFGYVSHVTLSVAVLVFAFYQAEIAVTPRLLLVLAGMLAGAALVQASFLILASAPGFILINGNPAMDIVWDLKRFADYPITIYHLSLQTVLTFVLPVAFMSFYPATALLGKDNGTPFPNALGMLTPLVGAVLFALSIAVWNGCLSRYQSTGS